MKKIFLIFFLTMLCSSMAFSKDIVVGKYHCGYDEKDYEVKVGAENGDYEMLMIGIPNKSSYRTCLIGEKKKRLAKFRVMLTLMRDKYKEWRQIAIENKVNDMTKDFSIDCPKIGVYWISSMAFGNNSVRPKLRFQVGYNEILDKTFYVAHLSGNVYATNNHYISCTYMLPFMDESEFDALLDILSDENISKKIESESSTSDLFK